MAVMAILLFFMLHKCTPCAVFLQPGLSVQLNLFIFVYKTGQMARTIFCISVMLFSEMLHAQTIKPLQIHVRRTDTLRKTPAFLPANFATCNFGFFCKQELRLEKQVHIPIKFRLGSIEYTNWLEGKLKIKP